MTAQNTLTSIKKYLPLITFVTFFTAIILCLRPSIAHQLSLSMDSLHYLSSAFNLYSGQGISIHNYSSLESNYTPLTVWPPLQAITLSTTCIFDDCSPNTIWKNTLWINALFLLLSAFIIFRILKNNTHYAIAVLGGCMFIITPITQVVFNYLWSEPGFIVFTLLSLLLLKEYDKKNDNRYLLAAAASLALATSFRYIGLSFCIASCLYLIVTSNDKFLTKLKASLTFFFAYSFTISAVALRNLIYTQSLSGADRGSPNFRLIEDFNTLLLVIRSELFLGNSLIFGFFIFSILLSILALSIIKKTKLSNVISSPTIETLWIIIYIGFLLISRSTQNIDLDGRMIFPIIPLFIIRLASCVRTTDTKTILASSLPLITLCVCLSIGGANSLNKLKRHMDEFGEIGNINDIYYPNFHSNRFESYRKIAKHFALSHNDIIISDVSRPIMLSVLFPNTPIKTYTHNNQNINELIRNKTGLLILNRSQNIEYFRSVSPSDTTVHFIKNSKKETEFWVIPLPLTTKITKTQKE